MKLFLQICTLVLFSQAVFAAEATHFGKALTLTQKTDWATVATAPEKYISTKVLTEAQVKKVCEKKGCWMEVGAADASQSMRVTFKDYGFFVPKEILNKKILIEGQVVAKTLSVKDQKHFLEDAKASKEEIEKIKEPKDIYEFVATGVKI